MVDAGGRPTIRAGIVSPAGVQIVAVIRSTPDDHFAAGPDCRVTESGRGRVGGAGGCPTIRAGIVSPAGVQIDVPSSLHPRRSFRCRSRLPCDRIGQRARWSCWWLSNYSCWDCISRQCSKALCHHGSAPDDHFTAGPHCRVIVSAQRARWWCWWLSNYPCRDCISRRCSNSWPGSAFRPRRSFHCRSTLPCEPLGQRARWSCWWLSNYPYWDCISRRCSNCCRYHHLRPRRSFHCRSRLPCDRSGRGRIGGARSSPRIICARRITRVGNSGKSVDNLP